MPKKIEESTTTIGGCVYISDLLNIVEEIKGNTIMFVDEKDQVWQLKKVNQLIEKDEKSI